MLGFIALAAILSLSFAYLILWPVTRYFIDAKGLRKYPSYSWLSGLTDYHFSYVAAKGFRSKELYEEHIRRGEPILRIGPNSLSFNDTKAVKGIYGHGTKCLKDGNYSATAGSHRQLFDVVDPADHSRKRRLLSAAFAIKNLERWEYKVEYTTLRLFKAFDSKCTLPLKGSIPDPHDVNLDFNHWINLWTIEAINYIALSSQMDLLDTGSDEVTAEKRDGTLYRANYRVGMNQSAKFSSVFVWDYKLFPWMKWIAKTIPGYYRNMYKEGEVWDDVVYHQVAERYRRYEKGEKLGDFFACLMDDKEGNPNNLEWGEIVAEVGGLINAGFDTTGTALTNIMGLLIRHPKVLSRLREEVDSVLEPEDIVAPYDKIKDLPFLKACLDESLRIIPPTSFGLPRRTPTQGLDIMGEWIPGDTSVNMSIYAAHRDPKIFPNPEKFDPDRWMNPAERKRMEPNFLAFSTGGRGCLGRNITYLEQTMLVASLVHRYDFALPEPDFEPPIYEAFNLLVGTLPIKIWRRHLS